MKKKNTNLISATFTIFAIFVNFDFSKHMRHFIKWVGHMCK